jgi:hypothetical protein
MAAQQTARHPSRPRVNALKTQTGRGFCRSRGGYTVRGMSSLFVGSLAVVYMNVAKKAMMLVQRAPKLLVGSRASRGTGASEIDGRHFQCSALQECRIPIDSNITVAMSVGPELQLR